MIVTIPEKDQHEGIFSMTVFINDYCPVCGGKRGEPIEGLSFDGSRRLEVHEWRNPCGHLDLYKHVRAQVRRRMQFQHQHRGLNFPLTQKLPLKINLDL